MTDVLEATVSSTARLSETELGRIQQRLAESMGKTIQLRTELDPHLIGGIRVRIGNLVLDGSVRGHLNALGRSFSQAFRR
jgi:F-type H+-transporting ATPase subunit delta